MRGGLFEVGGGGVSLGFFWTSCVLGHVQAEGLRSELCQAELQRTEAETKAVQADDKLRRLTDVANEMEETAAENDSLTSQVLD